MSKTCPTCGSDKRDINGRAWLRMREGNCPDPWHDQPDTDAVEEAWERLRCNGNYEGRTHDRETIDAFLDMENGGMPVTAGLTDDTTVGSTAAPPDTDAVEAALERIKCALFPQEDFCWRMEQDDTDEAGCGECIPASLATLRSTITALRAENERLRTLKSGWIKREHYLSAQFRALWERCIGYQGADGVPYCRICGAAEQERFPLVHEPDCPVEALRPLMERDE